MAINLRSPIFIGNTISVDGYNVYEIYIYEVTQPATPQYTIRKNYNSNFNAGKIEISELVRDYLEINFDGDYTSQAIKVSVDVEEFESDGSSTTDSIYDGEIAFDSYSYFEESGFDVIDNPIMISNRLIFGLNGSLVRVPINTAKSPTVTFIRNGNVVGTQTYTADSVVANQIKYATVNGESDEDTFIERVIDDGGSYESNICISNFFNQFDYGEVDKIIVDSSTTNPEIINVKVLEECKYTPKKVTFINKFGALQDMYFFKKSVEQMNIKKENYKANILDSSFGYDKSTHVNRDFNLSGNESITLSSGYLSEEYNEVFKQLLLSEKVWVTNITDTEEQVLPINVKTSNITYKTSLNDRLVEYTIEFDNSHNVINNIR